MKVTIYFQNDPSVGIFSTYYEAEIPDILLENFYTHKEWKEELERTRMALRHLWSELDGEFTASWVMFDFEIEEMQQEEIELDKAMRRHIAEDKYYQDYLPF